jgi:hypothetical protein
MTLLAAIATAVRGGYHVPLAERTRRITAGLAERKGSGCWVGRIPLGYRRPLVELDDGRRVWSDQLERDPETALVIERIYAEALAGEMCPAIANGLNRDHVATGLGGIWTPKPVSKVLNNRTYVGRWGAPTLVDPETASLLRWPRPRRPLEGPTAYGRRLAAMSPERLADLRASRRAGAHRQRERERIKADQTKGDTGQ